MTCLNATCLAAVGLSREWRDLAVMVAAAVLAALLDWVRREKR